VLTLLATRTNSGHILRTRGREESMNKKLLAVIALAFIVVVGIVIALVTSMRSATNTTTNGLAPGTINYTNAITGKTVEDKPAEQTPFQFGVIPQAASDIENLEDVYSYFSTDQASNLYTELNNFLLAHSGLANVAAGIKAGSIKKTDTPTTVSFTLVVLNPQATYQVTAKVTNTYQTIPEITVKQVEQAQ
jgi:hypothetical protein